MLLLLRGQVFFISLIFECPDMSRLSEEVSVAMILTLNILNERQVAACYAEWDQLLQAAPGH